MVPSPDPPEVAVLSIGVKLGGTDGNADRWRRAATALARDVIAARQGSPDSPLRLNVVFHVNGAMAPVTFDAIRTARFSKVDRHLMVQIPLTGDCPPDARNSLLSDVYTALEAAEDFARRRGIASALDEIRQVVRRLE